MLTQSNKPWPSSAPRSFKGAVQQQNELKLALGSCADSIVKSADTRFPELCIASPVLLYEIASTRLSVQKQLCLTSEIQSREGTVWWKHKHF